MNVNTIILIVSFLLFCLCVAVFFFVMNKFKYKEVLSKIVVLVILGIAFYKIFKNGFSNLGIISGAIVLGFTWGGTFAVQTKHFFNTIQMLFYACLVGWLVSFGIACLEFGDIPFDTSMRNVSLIGLGFSAVSTLLSSGSMFSLIASDYESYTEGTSKPTHKKIKATTYDYGLFKETTYKDEDGKKTTVEHWKF